MKSRYLILVKKFFLIFFLLSINTNIENSEIIKKIEVSGNDRLAKETVILFTELKIKEKIDSNKLNEAFKKLFDTDYFQNIEINSNNGIVKIRVIENPIIQTIIINGINNQSILSELKEITKNLKNILI